MKMSVEDECDEMGLTFDDCTISSETNCCMGLTVGMGIGCLDLSRLELSGIPSLEGPLLSLLPEYLTKLKILQITCCSYLKSLHFINWHSIEVIEISRCNKLRNFTMSKCPRLFNMTLQKCHLLDLLEVDCISLAVFDTSSSRIDCLILRSDVLQNVNLSDIQDYSVDVRCPSLTSLSVSRCSNINSEALSTILRRFPLLQTLAISDCPNITSLYVFESVKVLSLSKLPKLSSLRLEPECGLTEASFHELPKLSEYGTEIMLLNMFNMDSLTYLSLSLPEGEHNLTINHSYLRHLEVVRTGNLKELYLVTPRLNTLILKECYEMKKVSIACRSFPSTHKCDTLTIKELELKLPSCADDFYLTIRNFCTCIEKLVLTCTVITPEIQRFLLYLGHYLPRLAYVTLCSPLLSEPLEYTLDADELVRKKNLEMMCYLLPSYQERETETKRTILM